MNFLTFLNIGWFDTEWPKKGPKFVLEKVQNLKCPPLEIW